MRKRLGIIILIPLLALTVILIVVAVKCEETPLLESLTFVENTCGMEIELYYDETTDVYYLFLPAYTDISCVELKAPSNFKISYGEGESDISNLPLSEDVNLTVACGRRTETLVLQVWQCDNLDTICIQTETGSMEAVDADKSYEEDAAVAFINADGSIEYEGMTTINKRGNTTLDCEKKAYNLDFDDEITLWDGEYTNVTKLCLLANYYDESNLKNYIGYYTAKFMGVEYTSNYHLVNVYANGEYLGLYGVTTKQEYKNHIEEDEIVAAFAYAYTGRGDFTTDNGTAIEILYGDETYILEVLEAFEAAIVDGDYEEAYKYIDIESFANKCALEEYLINWDASWVSQYFYIGEDGKMRCMCAWDYDLALYTPTIEIVENLPITMRTYFSAYQSSTTDRFWWRLLLSDESFRSEVADVIESKYDDAFYEYLFEVVDAYIEKIDASWQCNYKRWHNETTYSNPTFSFETLAEYEGTIAQLLANRSAFLLDYLQNIEDYCLVQFLNKDGYAPSVQSYSNVCLPKGTALNALIDEYGWNSRLEEYNATWQTVDGISIDEVSELTEDLVFYVTLEEEEEVVSVQATNTTTETVASTSIKTRLKAWLKEAAPEPILWLKRYLGFRNTLIVATFALLYLLALFIWLSRMPRKKHNRRKGEAE